MIIAIPKEKADNETRVALTPEVAGKYVENGHELWIETDAGKKAGKLDEAYKEKGAKIVEDHDEIYRNADLLLKIQAPDSHEITLMKEGTVLICFLWALQNGDLVEQLKKHHITALGMDAIPRISRAQSMDALSSMSSLAGYKSALLGATNLGKYFPMMMTAAGTIPPSKVLVLGAGVAGLQAIATAKRLGAVVEAFDIRPAVKEQVESLGATFIEIPDIEDDTETEGGYAKELSKDSQERQRQVIHQHAKKSDVIITTALIPGKKAPLLITEDMVKDMEAGSVVVDLAAEQGGNCALTEPGETVIRYNVNILGPLNIPATLPQHASQLYAKNMHSLLNHLLEDDKLAFDFEDEITLKTTITHQGEIISPLLNDK